MEPVPPVPARPGSIAGTERCSARSFMLTAPNRVPDPVWCKRLLKVCKSPTATKPASPRQEGEKLEKSCGRKKVWAFLFEESLPEALEWEGAWRELWNSDLDCKRNQSGVSCCNWKRQNCQNSLDLRLLETTSQLFSKLVLSKAKRKLSLSAEISLKKKSAVLGI